jgi:excinuclease ABC subunit A
VDDLPKLKKTEKHDIDVVIDRLKVRARRPAAAPGRELRGRAAHGRRPRHRAGDGHRPRTPVQQQVRLPVCSYSLPELEPRLFSFNSPVGACPACDGLGHGDGVRPERVVAFPSLSLAGGAVKGWDRRNAYTFSLLESVARHYGFDIETPFEQLPRAGAAGAAARLGRRRDRVRL